MIDSQAIAREAARIFQYRRDPALRRALRAMAAGDGGPHHLSIVRYHAQQLAKHTFSADVRRDALKLEGMTHV